MEKIMYNGRVSETYNEFNDSEFVIGSKVIHNGIEMIVDDVYWNTLQHTWMYGVHENATSPGPSVEVSQDKLFPFVEHPVYQGN